MNRSKRRGGSTHTASVLWDSSWPELLEGEGSGEVWGFLEARFGIPPRVREEYTLWQRGNTYWVLSNATSTVHAFAALRVVCVGLPVLRRVRDRLKPTTAGLRLLSPWIRTNRIRLDDSQVRELLSKGEIPWAGDDAEGYVLLQTNQGNLGCGLLLGDKLRSQIPKSDVKALDLE